MQKSNNGCHCTGQKPGSCSIHRTDISVVPFTSPETPLRHPKQANALLLVPRHYEMVRIVAEDTTRFDFMTEKNQAELSWKLPCCQPWFTGLKVLCRLLGRRSHQQCHSAADASSYSNDTDATVPRHSQANQQLAPRPSPQTAIPT